MKKWNYFRNMFSYLKPIATLLLWNDGTVSDITAENQVTLEKPKWRIFVKQPSIQVQLFMIFNTNSTQKQRQLLRILNNLENRPFRNRENLQYKKTADSILLSLFMRNNGKCNNCHAAMHRLKQYSVFHQNPIFPKDHNMKKYQHYIDVRGEVF